MSTVITLQAIRQKVLAMRILVPRLTSILLCSFLIGAQRPDAPQGALSPATPVVAQPFALEQVRLLDSPLEAAALRDQKFLRGLELDRLLHNFRVTAGIPSRAEPLGGWESPTTELRGHFVGHYLSACAAMYASAGDTVLKAKADTIVAGLDECQRHLEGGYLSAFPEELFDRLESGKPVWAPWYTIHKIFQGLLDVYRLAGNARALAVAKKMGKWVGSRTGRLSDEHMQQTLNTEFGGMGESLLNLYALTGDREDLALAKRFEKRWFLDPLSQGIDRLKGLHVNTHIPQVIAAARTYEETKEERYRRIADFFWNQIVQARSYATGGTSNGEHWESEPYCLSRQLGPSTEESCCSYNMLKLTSHLFSWAPDARYAEYYERTLFNSILPAHDPSSGMLMYYKPLGSGWYKTFGTPRNSFWCCTGTGVESFATLGAFIYFHRENDLFVNLFIPSELRWHQMGLTLRQETPFPNEGRTRLIVHQERPARLRLNVRLPLWSRGAFRAKWNGAPSHPLTSPSGYLVFDGTWRGLDTIDVEYQMDLHLSLMPDDSTVASVIYGPLVLAGKLGSVPDSMRYGFMGPWTAPVPAPVLITGGAPPASWLERTAAGRLLWRTKGVGNPFDVELVPLGNIAGERYAVYWNIFTKEQYNALLRKEEGPGPYDGVIFGDSLSEEGHDLVGEGMNFTTQDGRKALASRDWFGVTLGVPMERAARLLITYLKSDSAQPYTLSVVDVPLRSAPAVSELSGGLIRESYDLPSELTRMRRTVGVAFVSRDERWGRKVLRCEVVGSN
ncbi:MAG TPA: beta-L-arabinofuranosidase domain-containing protein [Bacteroidota bacterium]|nr:beta-L-arabinofuranosidase domain-containing protein [Bacteroidota bacterium]